MSDKTIGYKIFEVVTMPLRALPLGFHYFCGDIIAWFFEKVLHYRLKTIMINLSRSFPDKKYKELEKICHEYYRHLGELIAETVWVGGCKYGKDRARRQHICNVVGDETLQQNIAEGRSVMVLTSHFGNWELLGTLFESAHGRDASKLPLQPQHFVAVYKRQKSPFWDTVMKETRFSIFPPDFTGIIESSNILRYALENRRDGIVKMYIFPTDQYPYKSATGISIPSFMNQPTRAMVGGVNLACKLGMPVYYLAIDRKERGHHEYRFVELSADASKSNVQELTEKFYEHLQEDVNANPSIYLWSHKRWK